MTPPPLAKRIGRRVEPLLLLARAGAGTVMIVAPGPVAAAWLGTRSRGHRRFVRIIGVRDLVLCAGHLRSDGHARTTWRRFAAAADLVDGTIAIDRAVTTRRPARAVIAVPAFGAALISSLASPRAR